MIQSVRRASVEDAAQAAECLRELGYGTSAAVVAAKLDALTSSVTDGIFVAPDCNRHRLLGVVSVHLIPLFHAPGHVARLTALAVRSDARRQGIGEALVAAAETFAREAGCGRVEVTSGDHRPEAHRFYEALGYQVDERRFIKHLSVPEI